LIAAVICDDESYDFYGDTLTATGTYEHILQTIHGCDSIIELTLAVNPTYFHQISDTIFDDEFYDFFGDMLDESGVYYHTLSTVHDCDSIIELTLTVIPRVFNVLVTALEGGTATGTGFNIPNNTPWEVEAFPYDCYTFVEWTEDGEHVTDDNPYTFVVTENRNLVAHFVPTSYEITLSANPVGMGIVSGGGLLLACKPTTVIASSTNPCYAFVNWTENDSIVSTDSAYLFIVTAPRNLVANFELITFNIFTLSNPTGAGITEGGGADTPCDSMVCLTATPAVGYKFVNWTEAGGDTSTNNPHCFQVFGDAIWTANFEQKLYEIITLSNPPYGGTTTGDGTYTHRELATVEAFPADCYEFVSWMINNVVVSTNTLYTFPVLGLSDTTYLVANFQRTSFDVIVLASPDAGGSVYGGGNYSCDSTATVTAIVAPDGCYEFDRWERDGVFVSNNLTYSFTVTEHTVLIAYFVQKPVQVMVFANPTGGGTVSGGGNHYYCGNTATVTATPNPCYIFTHWTIDNETVSFDSIYSFEVIEEVVLIAHFEIKTFHVTLQSDPPDVGILTGAGGYNCGDTLTVKAFAEGCYTFIGWTEDDNLLTLNPIYTFTVTEDRTLVANFELKALQIIAVPNPTGGGIVQGDGIYNCGDTATLLATPNEGYEFVNWTEANDTVWTTDEYSFTVSGFRSLYANFRLISCEVVLIAQPEEGGILLGSGIYNFGDTAFAMAFSNPCFSFVNWTKEGTPISWDAIYPFQVTESCTIVAHFEKDIFSITLTASPAGGGNPVCEIPSCLYPCGDSATLHANPLPEYEFLYWTENDTPVSSDDPYVFEVTGDHELIAHFALKTYEIVVQIDPEADCSEAFVSGGGTYSHGDTATVEAVSDPCCKFLWWTENGGVVSLQNPYSFTVTGPRTLEAKFESRDFNIILLASPPEGGAVSGGDIVSCDSSITVTATPTNSCWIFVGWWMTNGEFVSLDNPYTFSAIQSDTLVAHFELIEYTVTLLAEPLSVGAVAGGGNYFCGDTATVTATPNNSCYTFAGWWTQDGDSVSANNPYTFVVTEDVTLVAHFIDSVKITLLVEPQGAGTVTGDGFYSCYATVILTATAASDCYTFVNWTNEDGGVVSNNNPYIFSAATSQTLTANFAVKSFNIYVMANPSGGGTVEILSGGNAHDCGDTATVLATPNECYHFVNWTTIGGEELSTQPLYEFPVTGMSVLVANFAKDTCVITLIANPPKGGTLLGSGNYECGKSAVAMAFTNSCYTFINWTKNGVPVSEDKNYSFIVEETCTLIANFEQTHPYITVSAEPIHGGLAIESGEYPCGDSATFIAIPFSQYHFINWTENGVEVSKDNFYAFEVTGVRDLVAHFALTAYEVIVSASPPEGGAVSGGGNYNIGDTATVTVVPNPNGCCNFIGWMENGAYVSVQLSHSFQVTGNHHLIAIFECEVYEISLAASPPEFGEVTGEGSYSCGDLITVTATSTHDCWKFVNWTNENGSVASTEAQYTFEVSGDRMLTANFMPDDFNVVIMSNGGGTTFPSGDTIIPCISGGVALTVEAFTEDCYTFAGWWTPNGEFVSANNPYTFVVTESDTLVALFEVKSFTINIATEPTEGGTVSPNDTVYNCGDRVNLLAKPNECYTFVKWTENDTVYTDNPYIFEVTEDRNLVAHFEWSRYEITLLADPSEGGTVAGDGIYNCGDPITVEAQPNIGYHFTHWTENGIKVSDSATYIFSVKTERRLVAHFTPSILMVNIEINASAEHCDTVTVWGSGAYRYGENVTVEATVVERCCGFAGWTVNGVVVSTHPVYTFVVTESVTLIAHFEKPTYLVTVLVNDDFYGSADSTKYYETCDIAHVRAFENECYRFVNWTVNGIEVSTNYIYEFEVAEEVTLTANFSALEFDAYCHTLWNNTFELNLLKLSNSFEIIDCKWYKNGEQVLEAERKTINQFSYSAGPNANDFLSRQLAMFFPEDTHRLL
jgi:hypothetical protein